VLNGVVRNRRIFKKHYCHKKWYCFFIFSIFKKPKKALQLSRKKVSKVCSYCNVVRITIGIPIAIIITFFKTYTLLSSQKRNAVTAQKKGLL